MGKNRKNKNVIPGSSAIANTKKIQESQLCKLELPDRITQRYDESNVLLLPGKKIKAKKTIVKPQADKKIYTKKERKKLEKLLAAKKKKAARKELLEELEKVQATEDELSLMTSLSSMQTKGLKRHFNEIKWPQLQSKAVETPNILKGKNKRKKLVADTVKNVEPSSSEDDEDDTDDDKDDDEKSDLKDNKQVIVETSKSSTDDGQTTVIEEQFISEPVSQEVATPKINKIETPKINKIVTPIHETVHVPVHRTAEVEAARMKLPILAEEQSIMEEINSKPVVVLCGETGSGKTTQVPQFLYEAGYAREKMIGITEPRRVAAISMSKRIGEEMNLDSSVVSYQIRFEGNTTPDTKLKFMTDGVLLKEIQNDFLLTKYSVIIIDEAHERTVYTDILIGLLSRIAPLRYKRKNPLKLIIMSATLRVEDFTENRRLFKEVPTVIKVDSRQYPVSVHFNKHTKEDYVSEAYRKVCKIHKTLPGGGILVFVTGQQEINKLCAKLRKSFPMKNRKNALDESVEKDEDDEADKLIRRMKKSSKKSSKKGLAAVPKIDLNDYSELPLEEDGAGEKAEFSDIDDFNSDDEMQDETDFPDSERCSEPLYVVPFYSLLPGHLQAKVFQPPPEGTRLCVVSTNVAETSLTIPNVKYVVDTGKVKSRFYDKVTGVSAFIVTWISKASADQRAGRAGRTGPGHCYRLFSSAVFNDQFEKFSPPEICRRPIDDLVLQMKDLNINRVVNFPFPSSPDMLALKAAETRLRLLGALEELPKTLRLKELQGAEWSLKITPLGHAMASFPVAPCYAKMLALSHQHDLLPYVICIVSALTVQEVLLDGYVPSQEPDTQEKTKQRMMFWKQLRRSWAGEGDSLLLGDVMVLLKAVGAAEFANCAEVFCRQNGLRHKAIIEVRKLRSQLTSTVNMVLPSLNLCVDPKMKPPSEAQAKLLRQIILAGLPHHVARKVPNGEIKDAEEREKYKNAYKCTEMDELVYIHPNSLLHKERPEYIVYQEIVETTKLFMRGVTAIEAEWLPVYAKGLCNFSKPLELPKPDYKLNEDRVVCHMKSTFGPYNWELPEVELEYPDSPEKIRWFAVYLLDGKVFPKFENYRSVLLSTASTMVKSWARLQPRTESLFQALAAKRVVSKADLLKAWDEDKQYLLSEYLLWLPESMHSTVGAKWPLR